MAKSTKENLIRSGLELFCQYGFNAAGLDQILRQVGVTKTTFYNHFESKEQLICDVLGIHFQQRRQQLLDGMDRLGGTDPQKRLLSMFDVLHEIFSEDSFCGCMLLNAMIEFPSHHDQVHLTASEHALAYIALFEQSATEAGVDDAKAFAVKFSMLFDGAVVARQTMGVADAALQAREAAEILLGAAR